MKETIDRPARLLSLLQRAALPGTLLAAMAGCASSSAPEASRSHTYRGHLVMAPGAEAFLPCTSANSLWLTSNQSIHERLRAEYLTLVGEPYEEAFAVLRGTPGAQLDCSACREHAGSFHVEQIIEFRHSAGDDCR